MATGLEPEESGEHTFAYTLGAGLLLAAAGLVALLTLTTGATSHTQVKHPVVVIGVGCAIAVLMGIASWKTRHTRRLWPLCLGAIGAAVLNCVPMALTHTVTVTGQMLLVWPVLFAAGLLPGWAAWSTTGATLAAYGWVAAAAVGNQPLAVWAAIAVWLCVTTLVVTALRRRATVLGLRAAALTDQLRDQAEHDALTGLANRRAFDERLAARLADAAATRSPIALLVIDVDHFKRVNDTAGHAVGDEVLAHLGRLLTARVRPGDMPARIGGEEFAVVLPGCALPDAEERAQELRRAVETASANWPQAVTVSIGLAYSQDGSGFGSELTEAADRALYRAKADGRDTVRTAPVP